MKKPTPVAPGNKAKASQIPYPDLALTDQPVPNRADQSHPSRYLGKFVPVITGNLIALSLLLSLSACKDSTTEVVMNPTPGESSSLPSGSQPSSSPDPDVAVTTNTSTPPTDKPTSGQSQSNWRLTRWVQNNQPVTLLSKAEIYLNLEQGRFSGSGGCNQFGAAYRMEGGRVIVDPLQSTKRGCDEPVMEQETRFFAALQQVRQVTLANNERLTLTYGEGSTAGSLVFSPR